MEYLLRIDIQFHSQDDATARKKAVPIIILTEDGINKFDRSMNVKSKLQEIKPSSAPRRVSV